jgi:phosphate starvation-inducible protein PhoH and related proteins
MKTISFDLSPLEKERLANLCGELNQNLHTLERQLAVEIAQRSNHFKIIGPADAVEHARTILTTLYAKNLKNSEIAPELHLLMAAIPNQNPDLELEEREDLGAAIIKTPKEIIKPRGLNQLRYIKRIHQHDISFGIGPAGTGKTFLAVACAVQALVADKVARVILVRPAVEAGEHLGFLPGDLSQKVDPYLRPMYDALYALLGTERVLKLIEKQIIEVAPLAFMRGRTLNDAFVILDEAQNTTKEQMKMFLTRIGFQSTAVINGDITQVDLPKGKLSGLRHAIDVLANTPGISFTFFGGADVVRHPLVQKIVEAYDHYEDNDTQ